MERTRDTTWEKKRLMAVKLPTVWPKGVKGWKRRQGAKRKAHSQFLKMEEEEDAERRENTKKVENAENSHG